LSCIADILNYIGVIQVVVGELNFESLRDVGPEVGLETVDKGVTLFWFGQPVLVAKEFSDDKEGMIVGGEVRFVVDADMKLFTNKFVEVGDSPFVLIVGAGVEDLDSLEELLIAVQGVVLLKRDPKICQVIVEVAFGIVFLVLVVDNVACAE
jgi:hypothetical protein